MAAPSRGGEVLNYLFRHANNYRTYGMSDNRNAPNLLNNWCNMQPGKGKRAAADSPTKRRAKNDRKQGSGTPMSFDQQLGRPSYGLRLQLTGHKSVPALQDSYLGFLGVPRVLGV